MEICTKRMANITLKQQGGLKSDGQVNLLEISWCYPDMFGTEYLYMCPFWFLVVLIAHYSVCGSACKMIHKCVVHIV